MSAYMITTTAKMKNYNYKKFWIDETIIPELRVSGKDVSQALEAYIKLASGKFGVEISKNAVKNKEPMFCDTKNGPIQVGWVITASTLFESEYGLKPVRQFFDLWIQVEQLLFPEF